MADSLRCESWDNSIRAISDLYASLDESKDLLSELKRISPAMDHIAGRQESIYISQGDYSEEHWIIARSAAALSACCKFIFLLDENNKLDCLKHIEVVLKVIEKSHKKPISTALRLQFTLQLTLVEQLCKKHGIKMAKEIKKARRLNA